MAHEHFDAVVVGSGFGGAVSAYRLADAGRSVCVLERGREYPPGEFPRGVAALRSNYWDPSRGGVGLFNLWSFAGLDALVSSGVGGGSLIYANVLLPMEPEWFEGWPISRADLDHHYKQVRQMLQPSPYPLAHPDFANTPKATALAEAGRALGHRVVHPDLAVAFADGDRPPALAVPITESVPNMYGRTRTTCRLCGECDIGCNSGSKNSLDHTYLSAAKHRGADIRPLHEVVGLEPAMLSDGPGYLVHYVRHDASDPRPTRTLPRLTMTARRLVLAAGSLGTTYLLLKHGRNFPGLNTAALGTRFSGNGDLLGFVSRSYRRVGGRREVRPLEPSRGPVITTALLVRDPVDGRDHYIQDGGFPEFFGWLLEGRDLPGVIRRVAGVAWRRAVAVVTGDPRSDYGAELAALLGDGALSSGSMPLLGIGRDTPDGVMRISRDQLRVDWTTATSRRYFGRVRASMRDVARELGARFTDNPLWYLRRRVITVHPLGGCPMSDDPRTGVVDAYGEVHNHPGMYVVDGSVMPGPVGANPAFTIAAFADRAADRFVEPIGDRHGT